MTNSTPNTQAAPTEWAIGQPYRNSDLARAGATVVRPAVYQGGRSHHVITSTPCCKAVRKILAVYLTGEGSHPEKCTGCGWHFRITARSTGGPLSLGVYGIAWTSRGH